MSVRIFWNDRIQYGNLYPDVSHGLWNCGWCVASSQHVDSIDLSHCIVLPVRVTVTQGARKPLKPGPVTRTLT